MSCNPQCLEHRNGGKFTDNVGVVSTIQKGGCQAGRCLERQQTFELPPNAQLLWCRCRVLGARFSCSTGLRSLPVLQTPRQATGGLGPEVSQGVPQECPRKRRCPRLGHTECLGTLLGHSGARGQKGHGDTPTLPRTPPFSQAFPSHFGPEGTETSCSWLGGLQSQCQQWLKNWSSKISDCLYAEKCCAGAALVSCIARS